MKTIYEWRGEYRPPKNGEWYLDDDMSPNEALEDYRDFLPYWILSPPQIEEVDDARNNG